MDPDTVFTTPLTWFRGTQGSLDPTTFLNSRDLSLTGADLTVTPASPECMWNSEGNVCRKACSEAPQK